MVVEGGGCRRGAWSSISGRNGASRDLARLTGTYWTYARRTTNQLREQPRKRQSGEEYRISSVRLVIGKEDWWRMGEIGR